MLVIALPSAEGWPIEIDEVIKNMNFVVIVENLIYCILSNFPDLTRSAITYTE